MRKKRVIVLNDSLRFGVVIAIIVLLAFFSLKPELLEIISFSPAGQCSVNADLDSNGIVGSSDETIFWQEYALKNQDPLVPRWTGQIISDGGSLNFPLGVSDPEGFPLNYKIYCTRAVIGGVITVDCDVNNPNPYNVQIDNQGMLTWASPAGSVGSYTFTIEAKEDLSGLVNVPGLNVAEKVVRKSLSVRVEPASEPVFTNILIDGKDVSTFSDYIPATTNSLIETSVSDARGISGVELAFVGFGKPKIADKIANAVYNSGSGKWEYNLGNLNDDGLAHVTITAINGAGVRKSYPKFDIEI
ncbi:MAG: hypothetical protein AABX73_01600 [Nanoarchaeota archaeon]